MPNISRAAEHPDDALGLASSARRPDDADFGRPRPQPEQASGPERIPVAVIGQFVGDPSRVNGA